MTFRLLMITGLLVSAPFAKATLFFEDSFDYPVGEDALTTTPLWSSVRFPGSDGDIIAGSLSYTDDAGRQLRTRGAKALIDTADEPEEVRHRTPLNLSTHTGPALWVSLLGLQTAGDAQRFINLAFMTPDDTVQPPDRNNTDDDEAFSLGIASPTSPSGWSLYNRAVNNGRQTALSQVPTSQMSLLVGRVELNFEGGIAERYTFWINPPLGSPPDEAEGLSFLSADTLGEPASDFNAWTDLIAMRVGAGVARAPSPAASWLVDEIRVGSGWADVLPWSPPLELLAPLPTLRPGSDTTLTWRPAPGRIDVVESSSDLLTWVPYEASRHTGTEGETSASFTCPIPAGANTFYLRVRREP